MFVLIWEIAEHNLINLLDHNVELQTSLQHFSNFTNKIIDYVEFRVATIWKCEYRSKYHMIFLANFSINDMIVSINRFC